MLDTIAALFTRVRDISRRDTRQTRNFYVPMTYNKAGQRALWYRGAKAWQDIPLALRNCTNAKSFRRAYKTNPAGPAICPIIIYTAVSGFTRLFSLMQQLPIISYAYVLPIPNIYYHLLLIYLFYIYMLCNDIS